MFLGAAARAKDRDVDLFVGPLHTADGRMGKGPRGHHRTGRGTRRLDETPTAHLAIVSHRIGLQKPGSKTTVTRVNVSPVNPRPPIGQATCRRHALLRERRMSRRSMRLGIKTDEHEN